MNTQISRFLDIRIVLVVGVILLAGTAWYAGPLGGSNVGNHMGMMEGQMVESGATMSPGQHERGEGGTACCTGMMESMSNMHRSMHAMMHGEASRQTGGTTDDGVSDDVDLEAQTEQWLGRTAGFETIDDRTGESEVVVEVGGGSGLTYAPAAVRVDPGTTIRWVWTGRGGLHDVAFVSAEISTSLHGEQGAEYTYTFAEPGEYRYECTPHAPVGMRGVVIVEENGR